MTTYLWALQDPPPPQALSVTLLPYREERARAEDTRSQSVIPAFFGLFGLFRDRVSCSPADPPNAWITVVCHHARFSLGL